MSELKDKIKEHYDNLKDVAKEERQDSRIFHLRCFNNWIKAILIGKYVKRGDSVLDICGGKGGDLKKYSVGKISHLVLADLSDVSIQNAEERWRVSNYKFKAKFVVADCFQKTDSFVDKLEPGIMFDFVSAQFSLHYSFENQERAEALFYNISKRLKEGGIFVGTIPDANRIVKRVRQTNSPKISNSVFYIDFGLSIPTTFTPFGSMYTFWLEGVVDCPEFLVNLNVLKWVAAKFGLELVGQWNFHDFYNDHIKDSQNQRLFEQMRVFNEQGVLSDAEWEVASFYLAFVFQKKRSFS